MEEIMLLRCSNSQCSINRYYKTSMPRLGSIGSAWNHVPLSEQLRQNNMFRHVPVSERLSHVSTNHETRVRIPVGANFSLHSVQMLQNSTNGKLVTQLAEEIMFLGAQTSPQCSINRYCKTTMQFSPLNYDFVTPDTKRC